MKRKLTFFIIIILILVIVIYYIFNYIVYITQIDVKYVEKLEKALKSYDIVSLDECLNEDVEICYKNEHDTYLNCRKNILENMEHKNYTLTIYGGGNNIFKNSIQEIFTQVYGTFCGKDYGESNIIVYLKQTGLHSFEIIKLESSDEIFKELFF